MFDRYTATARRIMNAAREDAVRLHRERIEAEHLLLGLLRSEEGLAVGHMLRSGLDLEDLRRQLEGRVEIVPRPSTPPQPPFSAQARRVLERARQHADELGQQRIHSGHLLLGLLGERDGHAAEVLRRSRLRGEGLRAELAQGAGEEALER